MSKILVIGANGNLGGELVAAANNAGHETIAWDKQNMDVTDRLQVIKKIGDMQPATVFNCTGYTNVDGAETDTEIAELLNSAAPRYLAEACKNIGATMIHFSTGMVFPGVEPEGYSENSTPAPINNYGKTKLNGELAIADQTDDFYCIRTAWLYATPRNATAKKSFNEIMLDLAAAEKPIKGVTDEFGTPTYAKDLAEAVLQLILDNHPRGVYHLINEGVASRYDWTEEIFRIKGINKEIEPVSGKVFPRPAPRPKYEVLKNTKLPHMRPWQEALQDYLTNNHL